MFETLPDNVDMITAGKDVDLVHAEILLLLFPSSSAHLLHDIIFATSSRYDQPGFAKSSFKFITKFFLKTYKL